AASAGTVRPSSASRSSTRLIRLRSLDWALEVCHQLLAAARTGHDLHQLPAVSAPLIKDLLGRVHQQRNRRVLPLRHGREPMATDNLSAPAGAMTPAHADNSSNALRGAVVRRAEVA